MHVVSTWNAPSAVYHSAKAGEHALVIAKANRVELVRLYEDGLKHAHGVDLWGQITSLNVLPPRPSDSNVTTILATTDHPRPMCHILSWDASTDSLSIAHSLNLYTRADRPSEYYQGAVLDPISGVAVSLAFTSSVKVIPSLTAAGDLAEFDARIPELNVVSLAFLPSTSTPNINPILAILHIDAHLTRQIILRQIDLDERDLPLDTSSLLPSPFSVQPGASLLVPVSGKGSETGQGGGLLVLGGGIVKYIPLAAPSSSDAPRSPKHSKGKSSVSSSPGKKKRARSGTVSGAEKEVEDSNRRTLEFDLPFEEVTAYDWIDPSRLLLADTWGRVAVLVLQRDSSSEAVTGLKCGLLSGEVSSPTTITYLTRGIIYVGSHYGDNQLVRLLSRPTTVEPTTAAGSGNETSRTNLQVLQTYTNIAPISDALISHVEGSTQVILCSGAYNTGSIRIMRKSANFKERAVIEQLNHVTMMSPLRINYGDTTDRYLLASTLYSTALIDINSDSGPSSVGFEELGEDQLPALIRSVPTLVVGNLSGGAGSCIVQVTSEVVRVIDLMSGYAVSEWPAENERRGVMITTASVSPTQVVLGLAGGRLCYFTFDDEMKLVLSTSRFFESSDSSPLEISSLSITPVWSSTHADSSRVAAISFWGSNTIQLLSLPSLESLPSDEIGLSTKGEEHLPRSLLLHAFEQTSTPSDKSSTPSSSSPLSILAGLADGTLVAYEMDLSTNKVQNKRTIQLGNQPLRLTAVKYRKPGLSKVDGEAYQNVVFVSGSRPTMLFMENGRLQHSPIGLKDVSSACVFNSKAFPDSLLISRDNHVVIGQLDTLNELQTRTIAFGLENPVRIAHDPENGVYGVAMIKQIPPTSTSASGASSSYAMPISSLRLLDDINFEAVEDYNLPSSDEITSVISTFLSLKDETRRYWVVGSETMGGQAETGRVSVYAAQESGQVGLIASTTVLGSVSTVASLEGKIVVAAGAGIAVYELASGDDDKQLSLNRLSSWERGYQINQIRIRGNLIYTSDALRSVDVLRWKGEKLNLVARDHSSLWPVTIGVLGAREVLVAEGQGHIYSYLIKDGTIERAGAYYLGEQITEIREGSVTAASGKDGDVESRLVFFTNTGRIGVIAYVSQSFGLLLTSLERNLNNAVPGPGGMEHSNWRAPVTLDAFGESAQIGFVDGDFVEKFLEYPNAQAAKPAMEGKNSAQTIKEDYSAVVERLEKLQLIH